jgi:hypothetical protein
MTEIPTPKEVASELVKMWPHVQEMREEWTTCYIQYIHLISFLLLGALLSQNHFMLITHTGEYEKTHSINPGICRLKLWLLHYECATRAMQGTREAITVAKYPWGLHTVHNQCFTCGMWCSIEKWLHCSMVLQKSTTRIWINPTTSLDSLSDVVC